MRCIQCLIFRIHQVRLNAVIFFGLTVLLALATLCALSTYFHKGQPVVRTLRVNNLKTLRNTGGVDRALLSFDLNAGKVSGYLIDSSNKVHMFYHARIYMHRFETSFSLELETAIRFRCR